MRGFSLLRTLVILGISIIVAAMAWYALSQGSTSTSLLSTEVIANNGPDADLVATLLALRAVKLDGTIFSDPAFTNLRDFSTQIVPEAIGRPNPFAPLNSSVAPSSATTQTAQIFAPVAPASVQKSPPAPKKKPAAPADE